MMYNMPEEERIEMGLKGRQHVLDIYGFESYCNLWEETLLNVHERCGSWNTRKHKSWEFIDIK